MFTPTTALRLLSTPLESDYKNTLWFPDRTTQTNYFLGKTVRTYENFQYIKKNNTIVVEGEVDLLYNCNYIMYQNNNFSNKWFYAFINRIEWASNSSVRLHVSTDVIQTWFFDITYYQSYVDRCHSDTDVAGDNIVPEDFSTPDGGYQVAGELNVNPSNIAVFATANYNGASVEPTETNGMVSGAKIVSELDTSSTGLQYLSDTLQGYVKNGTASAVSRLQQYPGVFQKAGQSITFAKVPSSINGYTPVNKKLLSAAFIKCFISMYGNEATFSPAYITGANVRINANADKTSGTIIAVVANYSNQHIGNINITATIPESNWAYNQYKNDYNLHSGSNAMLQQRLPMQRANSIFGSVANLVNAAANGAAAISALGIGSTALAIPGVGPAITGMTTGRAAANLANTFAQGNDALTNLEINALGVDEISQQLQAISESYNAPATGNVTSSNGYIVTGMTYLTYGYKVPPADIAKRCDKYLSVYGYKQSEYRNINLHARASWTFIKTIGLNATGNFPDDDMNIIKKVFDNGVFFWVYNKTFGNFDQSNTIV